MINQDKMTARDIGAVWEAQELAAALTRTVEALPCRLFKEGEAGAMLDSLDKVRTFLNCADVPETPKRKPVELPRISSPYAVFKP